jgi:hypothetical protein
MGRWVRATASLDLLLTGYVFNNLHENIPVYCIPWTIDVKTGKKLECEEATLVTLDRSLTSLSEDQIITHKIQTVQ